MALPVQPLQQNREYLLGLSPTTSFGSESTSGAAYGSQPSSGTAAPSAPTSQPSAEGNFTGVGTGFLQAGQTKLAQTKGNLGELASQFRAQAGPARTFESAGGARLLDAAVSSSGTQNTRDQARGLVNATYGGPTQLDSNALAALSGAVRDVGGQAKGLLTGSGIASTLGTSIAGLTPGEAAFEARRYRYDPGFRGQAMSQVRDAQGLQGALGSEAQAARAYAQNRSEQEAGIARQARDYLGGKQSGIAKALADSVAAASQREAQLRAQFDQLQASGRVEDVPEEYRQALAGSAGRQEAAAAKARYDEIMQAYDGLQLGGSEGKRYKVNAGEAPLLEKIITKRGKEWYGLPVEATKGRHKGETVVRDLRKVKGLDKATERRLIERQRALEAQFGADLGRKNDKDKTPFRDVAPLYDLGAGYGESFADRVYKPTDFRSLFDFKEAAGLQPESLASEEQRQQFNTISEILDSQDRLGESTVPYEEAAIKAELQPYLDAEKAALEDRGVKLDEAEKRRRRQIKTARKRYKQAKAAELGTQIGSGVGSLVGLYLGGYYSPTHYLGAYLGKEIGEEVAR